MIAISEARKNQIEPHHVGIERAQFLQKRLVVDDPVWRPTTHHIELFQLRLLLANVVPHHRQADQRVRLQLSRYVKAIFIENALTGRKRADKANFHGPQLSESSCLKGRYSDHRTQERAPSHAVVVVERLLLHAERKT